MTPKQLDIELREINLKLRLINDIFDSPILDYEEYSLIYVNETVELINVLHNKIECLNLIKNTMLRKQENIEFLKRTEKYLLALESIDRLKQEESLSDKDNAFLNDLLDVVENYRKQQFKFGWMQGSRQMEQVEVWSKTFNLPIGKEVHLPALKRLDFGIGLVDSELNEAKLAFKELQDTISSPDMRSQEQHTEIIINYLCKLADDCGDGVWVYFRLLMEAGLHLIFADVFDAIFEANMSKSCKTEQEAQETVDYYMETTGVETYYVPSGLYFIVHAAKDYPDLEIKKDKVLKNKYWSKPDNKIREIITKLIKKESL